MLLSSLLIILIYLIRTVSLGFIFNFTCFYFHFSGNHYYFFIVSLLPSVFAIFIIFPDTLCQCLIDPQHRDNYLSKIPLPNDNFKGVTWQVSVGFRTLI